MRLFKPKKDTLEDQSLVIVSYPKSGRTWLRVILEDLNMSPKFSHAGVTFHVYDYTYESVLDDIDTFKNNKVVFLSRDPRDASISYFYQLKLRMKEFDGDMDEFLKHERHGIRSVCAFNTGWLKHAHQFNGFLHVQYEDLLNDTPQHIRTLINFIGTKIDDTTISKAVERNQFEKMKKKELSGELEKRFPNRFSKGDVETEDAMKVRKGQAGGFRDTLTPEQLNYCNTIMNEYGYDPEGINKIVKL